jgi:hypothetical protein
VLDVVVFSRRFNEKRLAGNNLVRGAARVLPDGRYRMVDGDRAHGLKSVTKSPTWSSTARRAVRGAAAHDLAERRRCGRHRRRSFTLAQNPVRLDIDRRASPS